MTNTIYKDTRQRLCWKDASIDGSGERFGKRIVVNIGTTTIVTIIITVIIITAIIIKIITIIMTTTRERAGSNNFCVQC